jgi:hypothetical protein
MAREESCSEVKTAFASQLDCESVVSENQKKVMPGGVANSHAACHRFATSLDRWIDSFT